MASLTRLFDMIRSANIRRKGLKEVKLMIIIALFSFIWVTNALAADSADNSDTVSDVFRFYKTHANGNLRKVVFDRSLVINCTTNDPTAKTDLYLYQYPNNERKKIVDNKLFSREGDVFTVRKFGVKTTGLYECSSINKYGQKITWNDPINTVTPAEEHHPKATISTKHKYLDVGNDFNLSCNSNDDLKWFKVIKNVYQIPRFKTEIEKSPENKNILTLLIVNAQVSDSGYYVCEAEYEDKNDTKTAHIIVLEPTRPQLTNHSSDVTVRSPLPISVYCEFRSYPLPNIKWYRGRKEIKGCFKTKSQKCKNERVILENRKAKMDLVKGYLTVLRTTYNDHGEYHCEASNTEGDDSINISVKVETQAQILGNSKSQQIITEVGKSIHITCQAKGQPIPLVHWTRANSPEVLNHGKGTANLTIQKANKEDMGNYTCNATNFYSDIKVFTVKELKSIINPHPAPDPRKAGRLESDHIIIIVICSTIIVFLIIGIFILFYRYRRQKMLSYSLGLEIADYQIDPDRSLLEQCKNLPYDSDWEFPEERLILGKTLGSGAFGQVLQAEAVGIQDLRPRDKTAEAVQMRTRLRRTSKKSLQETLKKGRCDSIAFSKQTVAVKTLKGGASKADYTDLASELKILIHIGEHRNIINILGACTRGRRLMVIIEYAPHGNLLMFLRQRRDIFEPKWVKTTDNPGQELTLVDLVIIAYSISQGMEFLASKKCVHRDLAARNILVGQDYVIKISDFGLARDIYQEDLYVKAGTGLLPIKWMALESLFDRVYTHMSDVWSFGIVLWEIFTLGGTPYPTVPLEQLLEYLTQGQRMLQPNSSPTELYFLMKQCWEYCPQDRPTFVEISFRLEQSFKNNVSEDVLGYLLLSKGSNTESNMAESGAATDESLPSRFVSSIQCHLPSRNNNEYDETSKVKKTVEKKPLLNHESAV